MCDGGFMSGKSIKYLEVLEPTLSTSLGDIIVKSLEQVEDLTHRFF